MNYATILHGGQLAKAVKESVTADVKLLLNQGINPRMSVVIASDDQSVFSYAQSKQRAAKTLGIELDVIDLGASASQQQLEQELFRLSNDPLVHGILLELPVAKNLNADKALEYISAKKDVDGLTRMNMGLIAIGEEERALTSATAQACIELAETQGAIAGKHIGLVGRGRTVGRPLISMLINRHVTLTVCHTRTRNLSQVLAPCDLVIIAIGKPSQIKGEHLTKGQVIIDAGINFVNDKLVGDVDVQSAQEKVAALTPVPGGVGPLTSAIIYRNLIKAISLQNIK